MPAAEGPAAIPVPAEEWIRHQKRLYRLYITENRQLRDVMLHMGKYNFVATYDLAPSSAGETWANIKLGVGSIRNNLPNGASPRI
jgi:hypothetical protein